MKVDVAHWRASTTPHAVIYAFNPDGSAMRHEHRNCRRCPCTLGFITRVPADSAELAPLRQLEVPR